MVSSSAHNAVKPVDHLGALADPGSPNTLVAFERGVASQFVEQLALVNLDGGSIVVLRVDGADPHARALHGARLLTEHEVETEIGGCSRGGEARIAGADDEQVNGFGLK